MTELPEKNIDPLRELLTRDLLEQPSSHFTDSVMKSVGLRTSNYIKYEPVISVKGWTGISVLILFLCYFGLSGNDSAFTGADKLTESLHSGITIIQNFTAGFFSLLLTLAAMAVLLLLTADSVYRRSRLNAA